MKVVIMSIANSESVRTKVALCIGPLEAAFEKLWSHDPLEQVVPPYLVLLHQLMRASVPLMGRGAEVCETLAATDPLARKLGAYYLGHIEDERDHDAWALEDLASAGYDVDCALSIVPSPQLANLVGSQYYWLNHHHPIMLMGYITVLEAFPPSKQRVDEIRDRSGVPEAAFRTLRIHGELDPTHSAEIDDTLNELPLGKTHLEMIGVSVLHTCEWLSRSVQSLRPVESLARTVR
jgi:hypothetical protein